jgi:hypothetical protein
MTAVWVAVATVGVATMLIKGAGPAMIGGRALPPVVLRLVVLLAPALLAGLVATAVLASDRRLVVDARAAGLVVAAVAVWRRAPALVVVILAAGTTALVRAFL